MKILVAYSGGKDSQASLIWIINQHGTKNVEAVFCDTGWENPITYKHIIDTCKDLKVKLVIVKSKKYDGMVDMAKKKGRFASTMARFCTSELKSIPFIDYVLEQKEHLLIIQGIRANESASRKKMQAQCTFFKYYFEPYNDKGKTFTYRKKDIKEFITKYADDIFRPVFNWSGLEVIEYIIKNGQYPNKLYYQGFKRVGCFPCFMAGHQEVKEILKRYPDRFNEIEKIEEEVQSSFFKIDYIPKRFQTGFDKKSGKKFTKACDIKKYLNGKNCTINMFEEEITSCSSYYHLCE
jgi:3'-phosphoadenosine 5'-phosphosulfate sulfotransferase (PAPS reductase)/FAD synthetase